MFSYLSFVVLVSWCYGFIVSISIFFDNISRLFRKLIYIAAYIYIFYGGKNVYPIPQKNAIALRRENIDIDVTST